MEKAAPRVATKPMCQFTGRKKKKERKKTRNLFMIPTAGLDRVEVKTRWKML